MRGMDQHNRLARAAALFLRQAAWTVTSEKRFPRPGGDDYVDLWATRGEHTVIIEVETSPRHALENLAKASFIPCDGYVILCPTGRCLEAVRRAVNRAEDRPDVDIRFATLPTLADLVARFSRRRITGGKAENESGESL